MPSAAEIFEAVRAGSLDKIKSCYESDRDLLYLSDAAGVSILLHAVYSGQKHIADFLVSKNGPVKFYEACALGRLDLAVKLFEKNPSVLNILSKDGFTPLDLAEAFGRSDVVRYLAGKGAKRSGKPLPNKKTKSLKTWLKNDGAD